MRSTAPASRLAREGIPVARASHRGGGGMPVLLKKWHGRGLAGAQLLHLAPQQLLLGLKLVLTAQRYL